MKPGDAVLVEATIDSMSDGSERGACRVALDGGLMVVLVSSLHALPDEATRRRAAELAALYESSAEHFARLAGKATSPSAETAAHDHPIIAAALRLLAGNAAEDKPAARCPERGAEAHVIAQIGREQYERDLADAAEEDGM